MELIIFAIVKVKNNEAPAKLRALKGFACTAVSYSMSAAPTAVGNTTKVSAAFAVR